MKTKYKGPYKSTTSEEMYFHVNNEATVFCRKEADGIWYGTAALVHPNDMFCRRTGRNVARRRFFRFRDDVFLIGTDKPTMQDAENVVQWEAEEFGLLEEESASE